MDEYRIKKHPILEKIQRKKIKFFFKDIELTAFEGEVIASALISHGIHCFGTHQKDNAPQGIFCANGQCAQCLVLADGKPVKSCITPVKEGMKVLPIEGVPSLPEDDEEISPKDVPEKEVDVLIVGGGPAGLSAALELAKYDDLSILIADDKHMLGGKLALQTHNFFGSISHCYAGTRGIDIGKHLANNIQKYPNIEVWLQSPVVGVFVDKKVGVVHENIYYLIKPKVLLISAGAREKNLAFPGCDLPGIYGAGAFQTLVNRDLVKSSKRLFIIGGGNVGLIAAYHAIQAGIEVVGLAEALPQCGGYKVHLDKIKRLGVPIYLSHTIIKALGKDHLESIIIGELDKNFNIIKDTEKYFEVDSLLIAIGLTPVNELLKKAKKYNMKVYGAGDSEIVAEASAAMFSGRITAKYILRELGYNVNIPSEWLKLAEILRKRPGKIYIQAKPPKKLIYPRIFCTQEIPCNPCTEICPMNAIKTHDNTIMGIPLFEGTCIGCGRCVAICPGLAITLVDREYDPDGEYALVTLPWELNDDIVKPGDKVITAGFEGEEIGVGRVVAIKESKWQDKRKFLLIEVPSEEADKVAGIKIFNISNTNIENKNKEEIIKKEIQNIKDEDIIVCRCQRVNKKEIVEEIKKGARDINDLKAGLECCMGACGGKTCEELILKIFKEQGINPNEVSRHVIRPFVQEVPLHTFLGKDKKCKN